MKKVFFLFVVMLVIGFSVPAFAEEPVPPAPGITKDEAQAIVNQLKAIQKENKNFSGVATRFAETSEAYLKVGKSQTEAIQEVGKKIDNVGSAVNNLQTNIQSSRQENFAGREENWKEFQNLGNQNVKNTWIIGCFIGVTLCVIAGLLWLFYHLSQKSTFKALDDSQESISKALKDKETAISAVLNDLGDKLLLNIPKATAKEIRQLDPTPFKFEVAGHKVCYTSPITEDDLYRIIHVPKDPDTDDPAAFEMLTEDNRGKALSSIRGTMKKFFERGFDTETPQNKLQVALIGYLQKTGALKIG